MSEIHSNADVTDKNSETQKQNDSVDPNKRVDTSKSSPKSQNTEVNPNKRVSETLENKAVSNNSDTVDPNKRVDADKEAGKQNDTSENEGLTQKQKEKIKKETGWSDEIIDHIESMEQYEIYKNANLHEAEINGKKCLVKNIDMDYVDPKTGLTNRELMAKGRSPIDAKTGEKIELHHMGQDKNGPFAELCENSEHGDGNHSTLHPKTEGSWRNEAGANENYNNERAEHWKARSQEA